MEDSLVLHSRWAFLLGCDVTGKLWISNTFSFLFYIHFLWLNLRSMDCKTQLDIAPRNSLEVNNKVEAEAVPINQVSATQSNTYVMILCTCDFHMLFPMYPILL